MQMHAQKHTHISLKWFSPYAVQPVSDKLAIDVDLYVKSVQVIVEWL